MSPLAQNEVRDRLHAALDDIHMSPRPLPELRRAVTRRRRERRVALVVAGGALVAVGITAGLAAGTGNGPGRSDKIVPTVPVHVDPGRALTAYLAAHKSTAHTDPVTGADEGTYAADIEGGKVQILSFDGRTWAPVAELGAPMPGPPVIAVHRGPNGAGDAAAFQVDEAGGDAVYNGVVVEDQGSWRYADFDCGRTTVACAGGGHRATPYALDGTEVAGAFHTEPNTCTPNCAAGTRYDVTWQWDRTTGTFVVLSAVTMNR